MQSFNVVCKIIFFSSFLAFEASAQNSILLREPFNFDPDSSSWIGDTDHFSLNDTSWQLYAAEPGETSILYPIPTKLDFIQASISLQFSPSNANNAQIILASDSEQLTGEWNGYMLQLGENGSNDNPELFAIRKGKKATSIHRFAIDISEENDLSITLEKQPNNGSSWLAIFSTTKNPESISFSFNWLPTNEIAFTHFGYHLRYTQSNTRAFSLNSCTLGYQLPTLVSHSSEASGVKLAFSHALKPQPEIAQFSIDNEPLNASIDAYNSVLIPWPADLGVGAATLSIKNLTLLGSGLLADTSVVIEKPYLPKNGDLILTEFLAIADSDTPEFIEFYNKSIYPISLNSLSIADGRDTLSLASILSESQELPPASYAIVGSDLEDFYDIPETAHYINTSLPTLNNGGDRIALLFNNTVPIDELTYSSNWVKAAESTERKRLDLPTAWQINWERAGETESLSPGFSNTVTLDNFPPSLLDFEWKQPDTLMVFFDESIDLSVELSLELIIANQSTPISYELLKRSTNRTIAFHLLSALPINQSIELRIIGITDLFGNISTNVQIPLFIRETAIPAYGDLRINEFLADAAASVGEFIELINVSDKLIDAKLLSLTDASNQRFRFNFFQNEQDRLFAPNKYLAMGNYTPSQNQQNYFYQSSFLSLNNSNEIIQLWYQDTLLIDEIAWDNLPSQNQLSTASYASIEKVDPLSAGLDNSKWKRTTSQVGHTLGLQNAEYFADTEPPRLMSAILIQDSLRLIFSEFSFPPEPFTFWIDGVRQQLNDVQPNKEKLYNEWKISLPVGSSIRVKEMEIINWEDSKGNLLASQSLAVIHKPKASEIAINEVFYQPIQNEDDGIPDQFEWLELYNPTAYHFMLNELVIHQGENERGFKNRIDFSSEEILTIEPDGYFVVSASAKTEDSYAQNMSTLYLAKRSLSLSNESSQLYLSTASFDKLDSVRYSSSWHHPALQIREGISLERIREDQNGFNEQNWGSNASNAGHSAGTKNSLSPIGEENNVVVGGKTELDALIEIHPQIFSPNGDGKDEVCEIKLIGSSQSEIVNAKIFDRTGLLIKKLTSNQRVAAQNFIVWNGRSDNNRPVPTGVYILWVEWKDFSTKKAYSLKKRLIIAPYN